MGNGLIIYRYCISSTLTDPYKIAYNFSNMRVNLHIWDFPVGSGLPLQNNKADESHGTIVICNRIGTFAGPVPSLH